MEKKPENRVYAVKCDDYGNTEPSITKLFVMMDGIERLFNPGENILLKANLLAVAEPDKAVTTHPGVIAEVGKCIKKAGGIPLIADSPGSGYKYNNKTLKKVYKITGLEKVSHQEKIKLNFDTSFKVVSYPEGKLVKRLEVITPVYEADHVFNICKLKTHTFMHMTGAVKNSFGVIPGLAKPGYHFKLNDKIHFADMLLDLSNYVSPRLSIMDAVVGMEGDGPGPSGKPRHVGLLLASENPLALDVIAGEIIGIESADNPILIQAKKRGMFPTNLNEVELIGITKSDLRIPDYKLPVTAVGSSGVDLMSKWKELIKPLFKNMMSVKPKVIKKKCQACAACIKSCPVKTIVLIKAKPDFEPDFARIDDEKCIRCYCCHEMCPEEAIQLKKSFFYKLLNK